jgi:hypothetical protein
MGGGKRLTSHSVNLRRSSKLGVMAGGASHTPGAYADPRYARSLGEFGVPTLLPRSGASLLRRPIESGDEYDAMGCYPLFTCPNWSGLADDLAELGSELVSVTVVTDPFGLPSYESLGEIFDVVTPYKDHYLVDLEQPLESTVARHHRKSARKALQALTIEEYDPTTDVDTWCQLYGHLVRKHSIDGIRAFSSASFEQQARIPGLVAFRALQDGDVIGMHWYLTAGDVVYAHLAALHPQSYRYYASHGLFWTAFQRFQGSFRWVDMGAGSGAAADDGLTEFKAGWSSQTAPTFICGKVINRDRYEELSRNVPSSTSYFPRYRAGEFTVRPPVEEADAR